VKIDKMMMVSIDYRLTNDKGELLDSSEGRGPLSYIQGMGEIIPGLERELEGKGKGDKFKVTIAPEDAYGEKSEENMINVPKEHLDGSRKYKVGDELELEGPYGHIICKVDQVSDDHVVLDANHPLAGVALTFDVTVRDVREATDDEINASSHACGGGCCSSDEDGGCQDESCCSGGGHGHGHGGCCDH